MAGLAAFQPPGVSQHLGDGIQGRLFQAGWNFLPLCRGHCLTHSQAREAGAADHVPGSCLFLALDHGKKPTGLFPNFSAGVGEMGQYFPPQLDSHNSLLLHWPTFSLEWKEASLRKRSRLPCPALHTLFQNLQQRPCSLELEDCGW